jgi:hypothetical protein
MLEEDEFGEVMVTLGAPADRTAGADEPPVLKKPAAGQPGGTRRAAEMRYLFEVLFHSAMVGLILAWLALSVLGSVDIDMAAQLFSGAKDRAAALLKHV